MNHARFRRGIAKTSSVEISSTQPKTGTKLIHIEYGSSPEVHVHMGHNLYPNYPRIGLVPVLGSCGIYSVSPPDLRLFVGGMLLASAALSSHRPAQRE
jgi:hypothetical protein